MHKFDTPAPITANLNIPAGRVEIIATDRTDTTVQVRPADASKGRDVKAAEQTTVEYADGVLRIQTAAGKKQLLGPSGSVAVTIALPAGSRVEGKAGSAELQTTGRLSEVAFDGAYQQTTIDQAASIRLTAHDGDVEVSRLDGPGEISTQRGNIRITQAGRGTLVLSTQSGDITITAAAGVSAALDARTGQGRVTNTLNNNGATELDIRATTMQGDITARSL